MTRYNGGTEVLGGYYLNLKSWEIATLRGERGILPGGGQYVFVPTPALLVLAPVMGGVFAVVLPFLGFAMPVWALARKLARASAKAMGEMAATVAPAWQPGEAYLAGQPEEKKDEKAAAKEQQDAPVAAALEPGKEPGKNSIDELAHEIDERRAGEKK